MKITDEMVEAGAKAMYEYETGLGEGSWGRPYEVERQLWREQVRTVLEAALATASDVAGEEKLPYLAQPPFVVQIGTLDRIQVGSTAPVSIHERAFVSWKFHSAHRGLHPAQLEADSLAEREEFVRVIRREVQDD